MKRLTELDLTKLCLLLLQITGLMPLVVGNLGKNDLKNVSIQTAAPSLQADLLASLSTEERRYLDHFRHTSTELLFARLNRAPLARHLTLTFEDLPPWRVKRSQGLSSSSSLPGALPPFPEPSSFGLTQTDREYFNIVRTENGVSDFFRFLPRKRMEDFLLKKKKKGMISSAKREEAKHRPKFIYHRVPGSLLPPFSGSTPNDTQTKDVAAVSLAKTVQGPVLPPTN